MTENKTDQTVTIVFGRWRSGDKEHIVGLFWNKEDAEKEAKEALVGEVPRWETWTREFWVK